MKIRFAAVLFVAVLFLAFAAAQDSDPAQASGQQGGGYGQRGGRGFGGGMMGAGQGVLGTVTEVAADHYTVKTDAGAVYTIHFSANTRIFKMPPYVRREGGEGGGQGAGQGMGRGNGGNPPTPIKPTDIKAGDVIEARGEVDATAKSVGAMAIVQVDPERARQIREMQANYGKTWLVGKVTAIDGVKVALMGSIDNVSYVFLADENTTFRRRRDPITLADIQVGDTIRVEGALKDGVFTATSVADMGAPGENPRVPRDGGPSQPPLPQ